MKLVIVSNHLYEGSYCSALLKAVINVLQTANHEVHLIHLGNDGFNPVMSKDDLKAFVDHNPIDSKLTGAVWKN